MPIDLPNCTPRLQLQIDSPERVLAHLWMTPHLKYSVVKGHEFSKDPSTHHSILGTVLPGDVVTTDHDRVRTRLLMSTSTSPNKIFWTVLIYSIVSCDSIELTGRKNVSLSDPMSQVLSCLVCWEFSSPNLQNNANLANNQSVSPALWAYW